MPSKHCNFGQPLDDMLRDRLVCGISDGTLQRRLLAEPDLTLKKALQLAQAQETAEMGAQQLQQQRPQTSSLHKIGQTKGRKPNNPRSERQPRERLCYRCGEHHSYTTRRFKDTVCHMCKRKDTSQRLAAAQILDNNQPLQIEQMHGTCREIRIK